MNKTYSETVIGSGRRDNNFNETKNIQSKILVRN